MQYMDLDKRGLWALENNSFKTLHTEHSQSTLIQTMCIKQHNAFSEMCLDCGMCSCLVITNLNSVGLASGSDWKALLF